jgi:hypothetical protein
LPSADPLASSGRKAAIRFSPVPKKKFEIIRAVMAMARSPGPAKYSATVPAMQPTVVTASAFFFAACASAQVPMNGAVTTIAA